MPKCFDLAPTYFWHCIHISRWPPGKYLPPQELFEILIFAIFNVIYSTRFPLYSILFYRGLYMYVRHGDFVIKAFQA